MKTVFFALLFFFISIFSAKAQVNTGGWFIADTINYNTGPLTGMFAVWAESTGAVFVPYSYYAYPPCKAYPSIRLSDTAMHMSRSLALTYDQNVIPPRPGWPAAIVLEKRFSVYNTPIGFELYYYVKSMLPSTWESIRFWYGFTYGDTGTFFYYPASDYHPYVDGWTLVSYGFVPPLPIPQFDRIRIVVGSWATHLEVSFDQLEISYGTGNHIIIDSFGDSLTTSVNNNPHPPLDFSLSQNFPNPFNSSTAIKFNLTKLNFVRLTVSDILGREVAVLVDGELPAGEHSATFIPPAVLPSGIYLYKSQAGKFTETKKMILLK